MMTWNLLAIKTCGYHLKCWTQETQSPPTHTDTYIHVCEYRYICVKTEAYVRYFPCLADLSLPAMPPIFGIGLHKMAGPLCPFRLTDIHNHLTTYRFFPMFGQSQSPWNHMDSKFNLQSIPNQSQRWLSSFPLKGTKNLREVHGNSDLWGERHRETRGFPSISLEKSEKNMERTIGCPSLFRKKS